MKIDQQAEIVLRRIADSTTHEVVLDVETSGLDWRRNFVCGWVFTFSANPSDTYYIPVRHGGGKNLLDWKAPTTEHYGSKDKQHPFEKALAKIALARRELRWIGHNEKFDLHFAANPVSKVLITGLTEDTMVTQAMINEFMKQFTLDACCEYFNIEGKKGGPLYKHLAGKFGGQPVAKETMGNFWRLAGDDAIGVDYATGDGSATWRLKDRQRLDIEAQQMVQVWEVERRLTRVLFRMEHRGMRLDEGRLDEVIDIVDGKLKRAKEILPPTLTNPKAPTQLEPAFRALGMQDKDFARTPGGKISFTEAWLQTNPLGRSILAARKYEHLKDSFLIPLKERHIWKGRVHTNYNQLRNDEFGVITGRLSSNEPNLQQFHKRNKELGKLLRSIFIPDEGKVFASADYSQIEPVLLAYYGRVKVLMDGYRAVPHIDAHSAVSMSVFGTKEEPWRQYGKVINQAILTGAGVGKIAAMLRAAGATDVDPYAIINDYHNSMPEIKRIQKESGARMRSRGYVISLLGRRARLKEMGEEYKALNRLLQCGNADIIKLKMCEIDEFFESEGDDTNLLNSIHDDLAYQFMPVYEWQYREALRIMTDVDKDSPTAVIKIDIPLHVDAKEGRNWAVATYGEMQEEMKV